MFLSVNSTPHATITATLLTPLYSDQSDLSILVTCTQVSCMQQSCTVFGAKNLYKEKPVQETATDMQVSRASQFV